MKNNFITKTLILTSLIALAFLAGSSFYQYSPLYKRMTKASAVIYPTQGNQASGTVIFEEKSDGLHINATIEGLTPGKHGFHIHEFGDCSCADAVCAGDHFNPTHMPHAGPNDTKRHLGDLGNITADKNGKGIYHHIDKKISLNGPYNIIGRGLIIHKDEDDLKSQPTGNAGARVGCGVIGIAKS